MRVRAMTIAMAALIGTAILPVRAQVPPTAADLLDKFAGALDSSSSKSFITKGESTMEHAYRFAGNWGGPVQNVQDSGVSHRRMEYRSDGERMHMREYSWGHVSRDFPSASQDRPLFYCLNWTEGELYRHSVQTGPEESGGFVMMAKFDSYRTPGVDANLRGHIVPSYERTDTILRRAQSLSVRPQTEKVGDSDCYVLEAKTESGSVVLWLNPTRGYHLARAEVKAQGGDLEYGRPLDAKQVHTMRWENFGYEEVNGKWMPMQVETFSDLDYGHGNFTRSNIRYERTEILLDPDHDALGSFLNPLEHPENDPELKNGTRVQKVGTPVRLIWRDRELIPDVDKEAIAALDEMAKEVIGNDDVPPAPGTHTDPAPTDLSATALLEKYAQAQDRLRSLLIEGDSTASRIATSGASVGTEVSRCSFRTDGERVSHRVSSYDGVLATKEKPGYRSFVWDGKRLIQYRKGVDPRNDRVFVANSPAERAKLVATGYRGASLLGFCPGDFERFDRILREAKDALPAPRLETVGGSECYVLELPTKRGKYQVWIDPNHGYLPAKLTVERKAGEQIEDPQYAGKSMVFSLEKVRFQQVDDVWVPVEADMQITTEAKPPTIRWHCKRTKVTLNPDHNALKSFVPDDIPDGARVQIGEEPRAEYVWRGGKPVKEVKDGTR